MFLVLLKKIQYQITGLELTVSNVVDAVKVLSSLIVIHVLALGLHNLHWIMRKKQLASRAVVEHQKTKQALVMFPKSEFILLVMFSVQLLKRKTFPQCSSRCCHLTAGPQNKAGGRKRTAFVL